MNKKYSLLLFVLFFSPVTTFALTLHSSVHETVQIRAFDGLQEVTLFAGNIEKEKPIVTDNSYHGLALLMFPEGQSYPVILGEQDLSLRISGANTPPEFNNSPENKILYVALQSDQPVSGSYAFAALMIEAKKLLESSSSIENMRDLDKKKKEFHHFVAQHYEKLRYSDMVRRLISQSFMMLEYVKYHVEGEPATKIKERYLHASISMAGDWLKLLQPHMPEHEVLNYIVGLYYQRSMVAYASVLNDNFPQQAYCPGEELKALKFPDSLLLTKKGGSMKTSSDKLQGQKVISLVSLECPVSMVKAVGDARRLTQQDKTAFLIVIPIEKLSEDHLAMQRMSSHNNMYFVDDEAWREKNLPKNVRLPFFQVLH